jgi:hypothetical protein
MGKKDKSAPVEDTTTKKAKDKTKSAPSNDFDDEMGDPAEGGDNWKVATALGELLVIRPLSVEKDIETEYGKTDAIRADVIVVNEKKPAKSETHEGVLIFQGMLQAALRDKVGKGLVVGRLVQGEKKPGKSAPYLLEKADDDEKDTCREALRAA